MDVEEETTKLKWLLIGLIAFVISGCYSYSELKYLTFGRTVDGKVKQSYTIQERARRFGTRDVLIVEYAYTDANGMPATAKDRFPDSDSAPAVGTPVKLEYLPGTEDSARLAGHRNWAVVLIFVLCAGLTSWFVISTWREGTADTRKKAAARKQMARR